MKSAALGNNTSGPEVTNISQHGLWLLLGQEELFLSFEQFPWFQSAPIGKVLHVSSLLRSTCIGPTSTLILPSNPSGILSGFRWSLASQANYSFKRTAATGCGNIMRRSAAAA
jgi:hypothetical protein